MILADANLRGREARKASKGSTTGRPKYKAATPTAEQFWTEG